MNERLKKIIDYIKEGNFPRNFCDFYCGEKTYPYYLSSEEVIFHVSYDDDYTIIEGLSDEEFNELCKCFGVKRRERFSQEVDNTKSEKKIFIDDVYAVESPNIKHMIDKDTYNKLKSSGFAFKEFSRAVYKGEPAVLYQAIHYHTIIFDEDNSQNS